MLEISKLTYQIADNLVLHDMNLVVEEKHYFSIAGENGAGKSTLIKIILDSIRNIDSGSVLVNGQDHKLKESRAGTAYLPEKFDVRKEVTGWQYLNFVYGIYRQDIDKSRIQSLCQQIGLEFERLMDKVDTYSKGMKQKLGLISCFMLNTPLIILDEPLSGLDPKARFQFKQLLKQERENNRTVFYSTHMLADAEEICDQFAILHQGKIVFSGTPQDCIKQFGASTLEQAYMKCISGC